MSDIDVKYSLGYSPNPVKVNFKLSIEDTTVKVSLSGVPPLIVTAKPDFSGNALESMISALATPLANAITLSLGAFAGDLINDHTFDLITIRPVPFNIEGVRVTLKPSNLHISNFNDQMKITGDVSMSIL